MTADELSFVRTELARLVVVGAVSKIGSRPLFCLPLGVVPKKNGKLRLIHDLRHLNKFLRRPPHFKMEDLGAVAAQLQEGDQLLSYDLEQGYYHVELHPSIRQFFGFQFEGQYYMWNVLPFGLSTAPLVFTKVMRPVVNHLRQIGLRINLYLDDFLQMVSAGDPIQQRELLLTTLRSLGLHVNIEKSVLTPTQRLVYLGMELCTEGRPTFSVPRAKIKAIRHEISRLLRETRPFPVRRLARVAGMCVSTLRAVLPGRMLLRNCYRQIALAGLNLGRTIELSTGARQDLEWWLQALTQWNGAAATPLPADLQLTTDASDLGWGATLGDLQARGDWTASSTARHINMRELSAVLLALRSFRRQVANRSLLLRSDNVTVVACVNKIYGRSFVLNNVMHKIWDFCIENNVTLRALWIPGVDNKEADRLSRAPDPTDWEVTPLAFRLIDATFGPHHIDRMASATNTKLARFNSRLFDPKAEAVNCFAQDWSPGLSYVAPPFSLIPLVLRHVIHCRAEATLVAPIWTGAWWWPLLQRLLVAPPLRLLGAEGVFQPGPSGRVEPFRNPRWTFAAFRISGLRA